MSNIYIQEPPTSGKVLLITSVGEIDVELWSREAPKACRNFVQLCMEGYYDGTIFHRLVANFIVQGGDPTGTGEGGESVFGKTFRDEFHTRLRFNRRGLLGMANAGPNDNGSQFFFTLGEANELNNKHTLFGKITGDTLYNMLKMGDLETDGNEKPIFPPKIIKTKILHDPFMNIVPRDLPKRPTVDGAREKKKKSQSKATKDFKLLSFGEEAEEDEEETLQVASKMKGKSKSSHDLIDDPRLSKLPAVNDNDLSRDQNKRSHSPDDESIVRSGRSNSSEEKSRDRRRRSDSPDLKSPKRAKNEEKSENGLGKIDTESKPPSKIEELRHESEQLIRDLKRMRSGKDEKKDKKEIEKEDNELTSTDAITEYKDDLAKYSHVKRSHQPRGSDRERATMALLAKFQKKIVHEDDMSDDDQQVEEKIDDEDDDEGDEYTDLVGTSWMNHKFVSVEDRKNKVMDANVYDADRYAIFDPRNPLNKRKLEASKEKMKEKQKRR